ncbi:Dolichyl-phosphate-mannose-protein mannosyltransferase [Sphingomonas guangdongensis]|uniref:Dolichyl-phosphate-mannose-protein mannosyltransferase n=1 Tax=Sphingomonas guangdongensis TaxID=1141890 RepID=A0A285R1Y0_9SPHN|nr:hypothetical protein [Sphingomonas guangdongensis]SOB87884.1 Dolichyl-phosphate-mannose-protein mannosyltransferase [Sphingomonas guangdongensis]
MTPPPPRWLWPVVCLIAALAAALRIAAAQGGLWLDEAWSAVFARDVGAPAGVFLRIHHDNNHHLNTLWLQLVGFHAAPVLQRGLSIASGAATVLVAAAFAARRGSVAAIVTAVLFAVSPILVTYGSEARGYAPMVLALLGAVLLIDRWLADRREPPLAVALAVLFLFGLLAQLTFAFSIPALGGWVVLRIWREGGPAAALRDAARLLILPLLTAAATLASVLILLPGAGGFQMGAFTPFTLTELGHGYGTMLAYALGLPLPAAAVIAAAGVAAAVLVRDPVIASRRPFYLLAIVAAPLAMATLRLGNTGMPRYHLLAAVALLLLGGDLAAIARLRRARLLAIGSLAFVTAASLLGAVRLVADQRADPGRALAIMAVTTPQDLSVALDRERASAVIEAAAAAHGAPVRFDRCGRWLFVDRDGTEPFAARPVRCGRYYSPVTEAHPTGLSGTHWRLYRRL